MNTFEKLALYKLQCQMKNGGGGSGPSTDTLNDVVLRGGYSSNPIFIQSESKAIGVTEEDTHLLLGSISEDATGTFNTLIGTINTTATTGTRNILIGTLGADFTTGSRNIGIGTNALQYNTIGNHNVGIGPNALNRIYDSGIVKYGTSSAYNTGVGSHALMWLESGVYNVAVGSGQTTPGGLSNGTIRHNGKHNVSVGVSALNNLVTGSSNVGIGTAAGSYLESGNSNIFIGYGAGGAPAIKTSSNNIFIGNSCNPSTDVSNTLMIHNYPRAISETQVWEAVGGTEVKDALISGNFASRELNINGKFSITPDKIAVADGNVAYNKQLVANSLGEFGWTPYTPTPPVVRLTSDYISSSTTRTTIPNFNFTVEAGKVYRVKVFGAYKTAAATTGGSIGLVLTGGGAGTIFGTAKMNIVATMTVPPEQVIRAISDVNTLAGSFATSTGLTAGAVGGVDLQIIFSCTTSGVLNIQWGSEIANSKATLLANSILEVVEI